jgi:tetratricopeptide (TPR) repeat protein
VKISSPIIAASLLALSLCLIGCTGKPTAPTSTPTQQASATPAVAATTDPAPAPTATPVLLLVTEDGETDTEAKALEAPDISPQQQKMLDKIASDMIVDSPASLLERGEVFLMAGEQGIGPAYDLGIADFTGVLKDEPDNHVALRYRGMAYTRTGQLDEAIADHKKLMELRPKDSYGYTVCATLLTEAGKDEEAILIYDKAVELGGKDSESARFNRAKAHARLNHKDLAKKDFEHLAKNAENPKILEESKTSLQSL